VQATGGISDRGRLDGAEARRGRYLTVRLKPRILVDVDDHGLGALLCRPPAGRAVIDDDGEVFEELAVKPAACGDRQRAAGGIPDLDVAEVRAQQRPAGCACVSPTRVLAPVPGPARGFDVSAPSPAPGGAAVFDRSASARHVTRCDKSRHCWSGCRLRLRRFRRRGLGLRLGGGPAPAFRSMTSGFRYPQMGCVRRSMLRQGWGARWPGVGAQFPDVSARLGGR